MTWDGLARELYSIWAFRVGQETPFDHLSDKELTAWREVVRYVFVEIEEDP